MPPVRAMRGRRAARSRTAHGWSGFGRGDLAREVADHAVDGHRPEVVAAAVAQAHGAGLRLAGAAHEHVGHPAKLRLADAVAELLVAVVELAAHARGPQAFVHGARVVGELLADGDHARLYGSQPRREGAGVVLGQDPDDALERAEDRAVDHHRGLGLSFPIAVLDTE